MHIPIYALALLASSTRTLKPRFGNSSVDVALETEIHALILMLALDQIWLMLPMPLWLYLPTSFSCIELISMESRDLELYVCMHLGCGVMVTMIKGFSTSTMLIHVRDGFQSRREV